MQPDCLDASEPALRCASIPVLSHSFGSWRISIDRRPFSSQDLAKHYNRQSHLWHAKISRFGFETAYRQLITTVLRQSRYRQDTRDMRVLDAGLGTGAMSSAFCDHVGRHIALDGIDISPEMLRQARQRLGYRDIDLTLQRADIHQLPYCDNTFDVVLAAHVVEHVPDPKQALDEIFRVLKPGGILICSITRSSLFGAFIQVLWRTHRVPRTMARAWLRTCGLQSVRAMPFDKHSAARQFSLGYVGKKPGG